MQGYSLFGYVNAVRQRSSKTLMVEGATDQKLISRLQHTFVDEKKCSLNGVIDGAEMLQDSSDPNLYGKGNRAKILELLNLHSNNPQVQSALLNKFGTLIDREWDGVTAGSEFIGPWQPPLQTPPHFTTFGHSIENYFFTFKSFKAYLVNAFSESVSREFLDALELRFPQMVALALSWSIGMRDSNLIKRAAGIVWRTRIDWSRGRYNFLPIVEAELVNRGAVLPADYLAKLNTDAATYMAAIGAGEPGIWLCHGHLGEEVLWSCVANLAAEYGCPSNILDAIERGNSDGRFRYLVDHLSREQIGESIPLKDAVEWLCT